MKKVMLTKEQATAFEKVKKYHTKAEIIEVHTHPIFSWTGEFYPVNEISIVDLVLALYETGYEVVEEVTQ